MASLQLRRPLNGIGGLSQAVIKHSFFLNIKKENIRPLVFFFYVDYNRIYVNEKVPIETIIIKKLVQIIFNNTLSVHKFMHTSLSGLIICHVHNIV